MNINQKSGLIAASVSIFFVAVNSTSFTASAATLMAGAGNVSGFLSREYNDLAEINRFFDNPSLVVNNLDYYELNGSSIGKSVNLSTYDPATYDPFNPESAFIDKVVKTGSLGTQIVDIVAIPTSSITFQNNVLNFKAGTGGSINSLGYVPSPSNDCDLDIGEAGTINGSSCFLGETALSFAVSVLKDTPTISSLTKTGSGFYQLLFKLTGGGARVLFNIPKTESKVEMDAFGALAIRNNGTSIFPAGYQRFTDAQSISTPLIPMNFGQEFNLDIAFGAIVTAKCLPRPVIKGEKFLGVADCEGTFVAESNFANTLTLTGVNVFDEEGNKVDNFMFTSDYGVKYLSSAPSSSVPEPSSISGIILMFGLSTLQFRKNLRQKKNS
ncbi:MAG: hypothetical protein KME64_37450 [Scytonematopsis contorta HA4267-MV1]|nr:hypothetical protein [Scytonematopsis contorta HA4267-MV1]